MVTNTTPKEVVKLVEELLVRELRTAQSLFRLVGEEQAALNRGDIARLMALSVKKEGLLDQFSGLEAACQNHAAMLSSFSDLESAERIDRLSAGIRALTERLREAAHANRLLAAIALQDAESRQAGLLLSTQTSLPALCAALLDAREAPHATPATGVQPVFSAQETGLVETMAGLYREEKAYRAVMQISSRMIAAV